MASLGGINIRFSADLAGFSKQMQNVQRELEKTSKQLQSTGKSLSAAITLPLTAIAGLSLKTFTELEGVKQAFDQLNNPDLLKNLQDATKNTVSDLELMKNAVQADNFKIPVEELGNLMEFARRRAKGTGESVDYLVNSIVTGIGRKSPLILDNLGISASDLKSKLGGVSMEAASIADVTKAVGEIAQRELKLMGEDTLTFGEMWKQTTTLVQNAFADIGAIIAPALKPLITFAQDLLKRFKELSPETKKWIVILGGIAAAIGPILVLAGTAIPAIISGFTFLTGPIGLVVAGLTAIAVVIAKNWAPIKKTLIDIANYFIDLYNESTFFRTSVETVILVFKQLWEYAKFVFEYLKNIVSSFVNQFVNGFKTVGKVFKAALTGNFSDIPNIIREAMTESVGIVGEFAGEFANDWKTMSENMAKNTQDAFDKIRTKEKIKFIGDSPAEAAKPSSAKSNVDDSKNPLGDGVKKLTADDLLEIEQIRESIAEMNAGLNDVLNRDNQLKLAVAVENAEGESFFGAITEQYEDFIESIETDLIDPFSERMEYLKEIGQEVAHALADTFDGLSNRLIDSLGLANDGFEGFIKGLVATITKLISMMLAQSLAQSIAGATASGTATGPLAIFTTPHFIATAVAGVLSAFAAIPKFETGGIVGGTSFYGDKILARVNSGELILNNKQQRRVYDAMSVSRNSNVAVTGEFRLQGDNLVAVIERSNKKTGRQT